jgi:adenosylcobinamide-phosphate synthase
MLLLVVGSGAVAWGIVAVGRWLHPLLGIFLESILLAACLAGRSLRDAAEDVLEPIRQGDLDCARQRLSLYVGRDTEKLSISEILRAILETVAENTVDGVTSPLFYGIVGSILSPGCAACLALAYKAASTLDSMIGYKTERYGAIGWCSARTEDFLTWLPCRLTVVTLAFLSGSPRHLWQQCRQEAILDPSPNSGWSECAYAVALGVQLGGTNTYGGEVKHKPLLGQPLRPIDAEVVRQALQLTRTTVLLWLSVGVLGVGLRYGMLGS